MITWERMQQTDALPVYAMMRDFYERRLGTVTDAMLWENLSRCTGPDALLEGWVILSEGALAGYAILSRGYDPARAAEIRRLEEFYIDRPFRRTRAARDFLEALPALYAGCAWVEAVAEKDTAVWRQLGYRAGGTVMRRACPPREPDPSAKPRPGRKKAT